MNSFKYIKKLKRPKIDIAKDTGKFIGVIKSNIKLINPIKKYPDKNMKKKSFFFNFLVINKPKPIIEKRVI